MRYTLTIECNSVDELERMVTRMATGINFNPDEPRCAPFGPDASKGLAPGQQVALTNVTVTESNPGPVFTVKEVQPQDIYKELRGMMEKFIAKNSAEDAKELLLSFGKERLRDLTVEEQHKLKEALEKKGYA